MGRIREVQKYSIPNTDLKFKNRIRTLIVFVPAAVPLLNPLDIFCRSQLYKELKEARDKVAQLEQQLLLTGCNNSSCQDKENSAPAAPRSKLMKRLVGRGGQGAKASACLG